MTSWRRYLEEESGLGFSRLQGWLVLTLLSETKIMQENQDGVCGNLLYVEGPCFGW